VKLFQHRIDSFGQSWIDIYRHTDASGGSDVPILNLHLGKSNNSSMTVKQGVTYTSGSLSHQTVVGGGSHVRAIGGLAEVGEEVIVTPGDHLLIESIIWSEE